MTVKNSPLLQDSANIVLRNRIFSWSGLLNPYHKAGVVLRPKGVIGRIQRRGVRRAQLFAEADNLASKKIAPPVVLIQVDIHEKDTNQVLFLSSQVSKNSIAPSFNREPSNASHQIFTSDGLDQTRVSKVVMCSVHLWAVSTLAEPEGACRLLSFITRYDLDTLTRCVRQVHQINLRRRRSSFFIELNLGSAYPRFRRFQECSDRTAPGNRHLPAQIIKFVA
ncbi:hypothetical protein KEM54_000037 [Ascosphaera aggregata]|nr:hypothetical protein KEM54_000037 [Ascosphaera aggregata]